MYPGHSAGCWLPPPRSCLAGRLDFLSRAGGCGAGGPGTGGTGRETVGADTGEVAGGKCGAVDPGAEDPERTLTSPGVIGDPPEASINRLTCAPAPETAQLPPLTSAADDSPGLISLSLSLSLSLSAASLSAAPLSLSLSAARLSFGVSLCVSLSL